jgi:fructokinase
MNVAYHLKKLGHNTALITTIGHDDFGKRLVELMEKYRISTEYFQIDYYFQTGKVKTNIQGACPSYESEEINQLTANVSI